MENVDKIENIAKELGFDLVGIANTTTGDERSAIDDKLDDWINDGCHADMKWFADSLEKRKDIFKVMPGAKSVACVAMNYYGGEDEKRKNKSFGQIARYAYGRDYHKIFDKKLKLFAQKLKEIFPENDFRYYSDTGPVSERSWATKSGLGFVGKNTNLITKYGSWVLLGEVITDIDVASYDNHDFSEPQFAAPAAAPVTGSAKNLLYEQNQSFSPAPVSSKPWLSSTQQINTCGSCRRCLDACPTGALVALPAGRQGPYTVDARKCISYLTIEHKGEIPVELREKIGNRIFGCDACQEVCPFNVGRQKEGINFKIAQNKPNSPYHTFNSYSKNMCDSDRGGDGDDESENNNRDENNNGDENDNKDSNGDENRNEGENKNEKNGEGGMVSCSHRCSLGEAGRQMGIAGSVRDLKEILSIKTDEEFLEKFAGSPVMRAKRRGLVRNACIVAGNSGDKSLIPYLKALLDDNDIIASHAKWAINRLDT